jgi:hypothetical protein
VEEEYQRSMAQRTSRLSLEVQLDQGKLAGTTQDSNLAPPHAPQLC